MQDQTGTQRGDGVICPWRFSRLELALVLLTGAGWSRALQRTFCCVVMTGRPLHYNIMELGACLAFNGGYSGVH